jgi:hypothetical protein
MRPRGPGATWPGGRPPDQCPVAPGDAALAGLARFDEPLPEVPGDSADHDREVRVGTGQGRARQGAGLAGLLADLNGRLSGKLDVQVLTPHPAGTMRRSAL